MQHTVDFIGIGVVKAATTWIARCLAAHPDICFPSHKELQFFNRPEQLARGIDYYLQQFDHCANKQHGEFTPRYLFDNTAQTIHDYFPQTKLLVCLRQPVERAFSHYQYSKNRGNESAKTFEAGLVRRPDYKDWGNYYDYLKPFYTLFGKENICVVLFEDIKADPVGVIQHIYAFLDVDDTFVPPTIDQKANVTKNISYRFPIINRSIHALKTLLRKGKIGHLLLRCIQTIGLSRVATKLLSLNRSKTPREQSVAALDPATRSMLYHHYEKDWPKLETLIGKNLDIWRTQ